mgnify:CR=1 FL=1
MKSLILIVDDDPGVRAALALILEEEGTHESTSAANASDALAKLAAREPAAVLCDVAMPGMDGLELQREVRRRWPDLPVVMISAHGELETAVTAVREGAYDYLVKPIDSTRLVHTLRRALEHRRLRRENEALRVETTTTDAFLGASPPMARLRDEIARAAPSDARILILGENGAGKELVAQTLHRLSRRADRPFVKLNSAALPKDLVESELFGHEAGAFTGAIRARKGRFELADGGTLFLDEIGDMESETQAKLLRVLSTNELERVGSSRSVPLDVRLISASNRDLQEEMRGGRFREDLYHRIAVIPIRVPPLRDRGDDILELFEEFLRASALTAGRSEIAVEPSARRLLNSYRWPGNVREMRNLAERIAIMHTSSSLSAEDLHGLLLPTPQNPEEAYEPSLAGIRGRQRESERELVERTLGEVGWNVTSAAERLGLDRASLHRKMRSFGIVRPGRSAP